MLLHKTTFGNAPAAIYLANHLNNLNNKLLTRKISTLLCRFQQITNELEQSNVAGCLSAHVLCSFDDMLHRRALAAYNLIDDIDELAAKLMHNVMCGSIKKLIRKSSKVRTCELAQAKIPKIDVKSPRNKLEFFAKGMNIASVIWREGAPLRVKYPINLNWVEDSITAKTLTEKSKIKLSRKNKPNTFY